MQRNHPPSVQADVDLSQSGFVLFQSHCALSSPKFFFFCLIMRYRVRIHMEDTLNHIDIVYFGFK